MPGLLYELQFPEFCEDEKMDTLERVFKKYGYYHELDMSKLTGDLFQFGHHPGKSSSAIGNQDSGRVRVLRTSSSTKMVGEAILSGSLKPNHIEIQDMRPTLIENDYIIGKH
ncbi:hypothetical protein ACOSQ4_022134 [Xanthoceras sorbifolium]